MISWCGIEFIGCPRGAGITRCGVVQGVVYTITQIDGANVYLSMNSEYQTAPEHAEDDDEDLPDADVAKRHCRSQFQSSMYPSFYAPLMRCVIILFKKGDSKNDVLDVGFFLSINSSQIYGEIIVFETFSSLLSLVLITFHRQLIRRQILS